MFARGGITDILVSNQVRDPVKLDRLAQLPLLGARILVCVDDVENVGELSAAAQKHGTSIECLVELDSGAGRCGVTDPGDVVRIARAIDAAEGLEFTGLQAYQGAMQHMHGYSDRRDAALASIGCARDAVQSLTQVGLPPKTVTGAGTGEVGVQPPVGLG